MAIKLIVCDVDGTLLDENQRVHERTRRAVSRAIDQNILVTIASGRSFALAHNVHKDLGMIGPLICLNGALVRDLVLTYANHTLPKDVLAYCYEFALAQDIVPMFFEQSRVYLPGVSTDKRLLEKIGLLPNEQNYYTFVEPGEPFSLLLQERDVNKICFVAPMHDRRDAAARLHAVRTELSRRIERAQAPAMGELTSSYWNNLELMPAGVDKGAGVRALAEAFHLLREEIMVLGDNENDLGMFAYAKYSVAMAGAPQHVKQAAAYVTMAVEDGGVGAAIERFAL